MKKKEKEAGELFANVIEYIYKSFVVRMWDSFTAGNINRQDANGQTCLHWAIKNKCDGFEWLIEQTLRYDNIDVNLQNKYGDTALQVAIKNKGWYGNPVIKLLEAKK